MVRSRFVLLLAVLSLHCLDVVVSAQRSPHDALRKHLGFTEADLQSIERGEVVARILETNHENEIAVVGVVWIDAAPESFVARQKDIEKFETGEGVWAVQKISRPPRLTAFQRMTVPEDDLDDLATCRVGSCPVKVDEPDLERLNKAVDWSAPDAYDQANRVIRQIALEGMEEYLAGGDRALGAYRDKKRPTFIDREFDELLANSPYVLEYNAALHRYLADFPGAKLPGADEYLYWSTVQFGLKPVVRISHVVIYPVERRGAAIRYVVASKMLYASHYFHTGLELKYLVQDSARPEAKGFYLVSVNRSRSDGLTGWFGGIVRNRAESGAQEGLARALAQTKRLFESK
jgi:hypothetical protein